MTSGPARIIWHITLDGTPARPGAEGFVDISFTEQLAGTLALHFPRAPSVVLLRLDEAALGKRLVVEPSRGGAMFPHVYGEIGPGDVVESVTVRRSVTGDFALGDLGRVY